MKHLEPRQFDTFLSLGQKSLVMFYADWCPFCQRFKPIFEQQQLEMNQKSSLKVYACKLNEDENPLWDKFSVNAVPTLIAFYSSKENGNQIIARRDAKMGIGLTKNDLDSIIKEVNKHK
jgi:thioredoxin 1